MNKPVNNWADAQIQSWIVEDEEALEHNKGHIEATDGGSQWIVAG